MACSTTIPAASPILETTLPTHSPYGGTVWSAFLIRARVRLTLGRPIDVSEFYGRQREREVLEILTKRLLKEIALLAGEADYRPELAGRFYKPGPARE